MLGRLTGRVVFQAERPQRATGRQEEWPGAVKPLHPHRGKGSLCNLVLPFPPRYPELHLRSKLYVARKLVEPVEAVLAHLQECPRPAFDAEGLGGGIHVDIYNLKLP